jgi:hypothetical protein
MACRTNARCGLSVVLMAVGIVQWAAGAAARAEGHDTVGAIHFDAPAGWKAVDQPGKTLRMYVSPDVNTTDQAVLIVAYGDSGGVFRAQFDQLVKSSIASRKVMKTGPVHEGRSRQGFAVLTQNLAAQDDDGMLVLARFIAADVNGRPGLLCYMASLPDAYEAHHAEVDKMLASISFGDSAPAAVGDAPPAGPASEEAAQKSAEQWARDADKRRKPHMILGDIVNSEGKPIKGLKGYIYIGGTTLRGDRSNFTLEVAEDGHFESVLPDGVYRVTPTFTVEYDGKSMPVQLVPMDGKTPHSFSSADGIVVGFRWVLMGRRPGAEGDSYVNNFGGHFTFCDLHEGDFKHRVGDHWPAGTKIRVLFTPTGPLIDGSEGRPAGFEMDARELQNIGQPPGASVPIGAYKASCELQTPDGQRHPLLMSIDPGGARRAPEVEIHFTRNTTDDVKDIKIWFSDSQR